jgi:hypothetical protein
MIQRFTIISVVSRGFAGTAASTSSLLTSLPRFTILITVFMTLTFMFEQVDSARAFAKRPPTSSTNIRFAALT